MKEREKDGVPAFSSLCLTYHTDHSASAEQNKDPLRQNWGREPGKSPEFVEKELSKCSDVKKKEKKNVFASL